MVRLMLVLAPVMCILSGIAVSSILTTYMKNLDAASKDKKAKRADMNYPFKNEVQHEYVLLKVCCKLIEFCSESFRVFVS